MIKEKDLYKVKRVVFDDSYDKELEHIGVIVKNTPSDDLWSKKYTLITITGSQYLLNSEQVKEIRIVRTVPKAVRNHMDKIAKCKKEKYKLEKKIYDIKKELEQDIIQVDKEINKLDKDLPELYMKEYGLYTKQEFNNKVKKIFREEMKDAYYRNHYSFGEPYNSVYAFNDEIELSIDVYNEKYATEGSLGIVYMEYDGSMHIAADKEKEEELVSKYARKSLKYTNLEEIKRQARNVNKTNKYYNVSVHPRIDIGDKNWLTLEIVIIFKPLKSGLNKKMVNEYHKALRKVLNK